ncbi:hypothetical protein RI367_004843 [Sorochytrium milnesiophthora]
MDSQPPQQPRRIWCYGCQQELPLPDNAALVCPACSDDFVELIENDTSAEELRALQGGGSEPDDFEDHMPPEEDDIQLDAPRPLAYPLDPLAALLGGGLFPPPTGPRQNMSQLLRQLTESLNHSAPSHGATTMMYTTFVNGQPVTTHTTTAPGGQPSFGNPFHTAGADAGAPPPNLVQLLGALQGLMTGGPLGGQFGDYAFGQEDFDRIVSNLMEQQNGHHGPAPASDDDIAALPETLITQKQVDCAICQDRYELNETVLQLPCSHLFHRPCVTPWLKTNASCPTCRQALGATSGADTERNQSGGGAPSSAAASTASNIPGSWT